jgi:D-lactate dehydrogenase
MVEVSARAGLPLWIPDDIGGHCCATIWHSKGYEEGNGIMANRTVESLWRWSDDGKAADRLRRELVLFRELPARSDLTSVPENRERHAALTILDSIAWAHDRLLPRLSIRRKAGAAVIHPSCSAIHLGLGGKLTRDRSRARRQGDHASVRWMLCFCR